MVSTVRGIVMPLDGKELHHLIIDPEKDFCPGGALGVDGAGEDMKRVGAMLERTRDITDDVHVTQDMHALFDIGHPMFWTLRNGKHPVPFVDLTGINGSPVSMVTLDMFKAGDVRCSVAPTSKSGPLYDWCEHYLGELEKAGRYYCSIWPPHCLKGDPGSTFYPDVLEAIKDWERCHIAMADIVTKGTNFRTEHYSAVQAEVPDPEDVGTHLNTKFIDLLQGITRDRSGKSEQKKGVRVLVSGIAGSHCVRFTLTDVADNFGEENLGNIVLLTDAMSPVIGCEQDQKEFIEDMASRGVQMALTTDF